MKKWVEESKNAVSGIKGEFGVFVDIRELKPLMPDSQEYMQQGQVLYKQAGMIRSVVILDNAITSMQFKRIAQQTGIYQWERYINSAAIPNWEKLGIDWIATGIDPDK